MRKMFIGLAAAVMLGLGGGAIQAGSHGGNWTLDGAASSLAFGSVKKDTVGETHFFRKLSGTVSPEGNVAVTIDLGSVDTLIEIRDERMIEHVFANAPEASFSASIDIGPLSELPAGEVKIVEVSGALTFLGREVPVDSEVAVTRLGENRVMVVSEGMIWLTTEEMGIDEGITKLQEIAELPGITRAFPVTFRLVFDHGM